MKDVWAEEEFSGWIEGILLNNFEVYGEDAQALIDLNCENALAAYQILSGEQQ